MDYHILAGQLLEDQLLMRPEPASRLIYALENGTLMALRYLERRNSGVHPKELSIGMAVSTARVATLLNHMEREGLIARRPDLEDNRQRLIFLTPRGKSLLEEKRGETVNILASALSELGEEDAREYLRLQRKLFQSIASVAKERRLNRNAPDSDIKNETGQKGETVCE